MDAKVNEETMASFRERIARRGIDVCAKADADYKIQVVRPDSVPMVGNVHIPTGRVASRESVEERFRKLKF
ncbi:MAG: hypothetical protein JO303_16010 [Caulobacteraceae bacterium]|nr:hypothetical protein [Caulobacteraceae bacterium]